MSKAISKYWWHLRCLIWCWRLGYFYWHDCYWYFRGMGEAFEENRIGGDSPREAVLEDLSYAD